MKKFLLLCCSLSLLMIPPADAQLRASVLAGPKISYTQNTGAAIHSNVGKGGYQGGIYLGYSFPKANIILETGLNLSKFDVVIDYGQGVEVDDNSPELRIHYKSYTAFQIPLRVKANLFSADSRWIFRPYTGFMLTFRNNQSFKPKQPFDFKLGEDGYFFTMHDGYQERQFHFPRFGTYEDHSVYSFEGGLEFGYKLKYNVELLGSISYQNSFMTMNSQVMYIYQESPVRYNDSFATTATSTLESVNFNIGVAYIFKRSKE